MIIPSTIKSVCFTGHRELSLTEEYLLIGKITRLIDYLVTHHKLENCYTGGAIGLDTLASQTILGLQNRHPGLILNLILPCVGQERKWSEEQKKKYNEIKLKASTVRTLSPFYYNGCMQARNKELLLSSDLCIAYLRPGTSSGGSLNTVIQAKKLGIPIINLADPESEYINEIS